MNNLPAEPDRTKRPRECLGLEKTNPEARVSSLHLVVQYCSQWLPEGDEMPEQVPQERESRQGSASCRILAE